jgi:hypothetical protein
MHIQQARSRPDGDRDQGVAVRILTFLGLVPSYWQYKYDDVTIQDSTEQLTMPRLHPRISHLRH